MVGVDAAEVEGDEMEEGMDTITNRNMSLVSEEPGLGVMVIVTSTPYCMDYTESLRDIYLPELATMLSLISGACV